MLNTRYQYTVACLGKKVITLLFILRGKEQHLHAINTRFGLSCGVFTGPDETNNAVFKASGTPPSEIGNKLPHHL